MYLGSRPYSQQDWPRNKVVICRCRESYLAYHPCRYLPEHHSALPTGLLKYKALQRSACWRCALRGGRHVLSSLTAAHHEFVPPAARIDFLHLFGGLHRMRHHLLLPVAHLPEDRAHLVSSASNSQIFKARSVSISTARTARSLCQAKTLQDL